MKIPETSFNSLFGAYWALETGRKSNVHKTFRRRPGHLLIHVQFTVLCSGKWIRFWGLIVLLLLLILLLCFKNIRTVAVPTENKLTYNKPVLIARGFINHIQSKLNQIIHDGEINPTSIYLFNVSNENSKMMCEIY